MYKTEEGIWVRDKGEEGVREQQKEYRDLIELFKGRDCGGVWDIGAHVGWFPWYVNKHIQPSEILCVECSPRQIEILRKNLPTNARLLVGALVPDDYRYGAVDLYLGKTYSSCDSTFTSVRGRQRVKVKPLKMEAIRAVLPFPQVVKLDCEGAEYHIDPVKHIPESVEVLVAEVHYNRKGQRELLTRFDEGMMEAGFSLLRPLKIDDYLKTSHITYTRPVK